MINSYSWVNPNFEAATGVDMNHGWKLHSDFIPNVEEDVMMDFFKELEKEKISFKFGTYEPGKRLTFYGQSIEERDRIASILDQKSFLMDVDDMLADQNRYSTTLDVNRKISQKTTGRFTTDYVAATPEGRPIFDEATGKIDLSRSAQGANPMQKKNMFYANRMGHLIQTGHLYEETLDELAQMAEEFPVMGELLHGKSGYKSPYATIEDLVSQKRNAGTLRPFAPFASPWGGFIGDHLTTQEEFAVMTRGLPRAAAGESQATTILSESINEISRPSLEGRQMISGGISSAPGPADLTSSPGRVTKRAANSTPVKRSLTRDASAAVASGARGSNNLRMLGIAAAMGVGAGAYGKMKNRLNNSQIEEDKRIEMRRRGII